MKKGSLPRGRIGKTRRILDRQDVRLLPKNPGDDFLTGSEWVTMANAVRLTTREIVVATLLLQGRTRKSIGSRLRVSPETVRVHIDRLFEKFNVQDRLALALRIARIREALRFESKTANGFS